jgi:DNA polymerase III epsilon subunit family exonuclease
MMLNSPLNHVPFAAIDVETTGLHPGRDQIVEIAVQRIEGLQLTDCWSTLVATNLPIPWSAQRIHGINNQMLIGQPSIKQALRQFFDFVGDAVLVEHSLGAFDVLFIEAAYGQTLAHYYVNTCTLSRVIDPLQQRHSLEACCQRYNITNAGAHRAAADAEATARLLLALLYRAWPRYARLVDLLAVARIDRTLGRHRCRL